MDTSSDQKTTQRQPDWSISARGIATHVETKKTLDTRYGIELRYRHDGEKLTYLYASLLAGGDSPVAKAAADTEYGLYGISRSTVSVQLDLRQRSLEIFASKYQVDPDFKAAVDKSPRDAAFFKGVGHTVLCIALGAVGWLPDTTVTVEAMPMRHHKDKRGNDIATLVKYYQRMGFRLVDAPDEELWATTEQVSLVARVSELMASCAKHARHSFSKDSIHVRVFRVDKYQEIEEPDKTKWPAVLR
jgi:hypothetical protein